MHDPVKEWQQCAYNARVCRCKVVKLVHMHSALFAPLAILVRQCGRHHRIDSDATQKDYDIH